MNWFSKKISPAQKWGLAAGALITEQHDDQSHHRLRIKLSKRKTRSWLQESWGVGDRSKLLENLVWLAERGHRCDYPELVSDMLDEISDATHTKDASNLSYPPLNAYALENHLETERLGFLAWDLVRLIDLARRGYRVGLLEESETWVWINHASRRLQEEFDCWVDMGKSWVLGFGIWKHSHEYEGSDEFAAEALDQLLHGHASPWRRLDWDTALKISPAQRLQEVLDSSPKNFCEECDSKLLFGGELVRGYRFCNWKCAKQSPSLKHIPDFPEELIHSTAIAAQKTSNCPRCEASAITPIEVHEFHYVVGLIFGQSIRSDAVVSCRLCGWKQQSGHILLTMLTGWWSKGGLFYSPIQLVRTFFCLLSFPRHGKPSNRLLHYVRRQMAEDLTPHAMLRARFSRAEFKEATENHPLPDRNTSRLAMAALCLAIISWASIFLPAVFPPFMYLSAILFPLASIASVVVGHLACLQIHKHPKLLGFNLAIWALVFAYPLALTTAYFAYRMIT